MSIEHPVHLLASDPDRQRIQRFALVWANTYEKPKKSSS